MSDKPKSIITMTITGVPSSSIAAERFPAVTYADMVVYVDFALIAAALAHEACFRKRHTVTAMHGAIVVKATNIREQRKRESKDG